MKKTKYNPSGKPVLVKSTGNKGTFIKNLDQHRKRLGKLLLRKGK